MFVETAKKPKICFVSLKFWNFLFSFNIFVVRVFALISEQFVNNGHQQRFKIEFTFGISRINFNFASVLEKK